jgi:GMP synthase (glutamine-hydrolysing)
MGPVVLVVQHEDDCPPAWFGEWLLAAGCTVDVRRPYAGDDLPTDLTTHDALLVLGGPMGAYDDDQHPWLRDTKELIREAAGAGVPTLGICLGHQLCAVALGGHVVRNPRGQQIGLVATGWLELATADPLVGTLTDVQRGVQWNDDVVDRLPDGAELLAETGAGEVQVARFAPTVWGVQLHPEADDRVLAPWAAEDTRRYDDDRIERGLAEVASARAELERAWRPLAESLVRLARASR